MERTRQSVSEKFVWPSIREDVSKWARECLHCQRAKVNKHTVAPIGDFSVPDRRFAHVNVDIVGPLPESNGFKYIFTAVDRFTRWPIAIPMKDITAETVMDSFAYGWVAHFGVPAAVTCDRGSQFTSALWSQLMQTWSIKLHHTTPYHPASNGLVERFHRRMKESLIALIDDERHQWYWHLPCTLLAIRTTLKPDVGASPAELVYGEGLAIPGSILPPSLDNDVDNGIRQNTLDHLRLEVARLQPSATSAHRRPRVNIPDELNNASHVFVLRGGQQPTLTSPYSGPYRVVSRTPDSFRVAIPGRGTETINIARLKPAVIDEDEVEGPQPVTPPSPPPPGRRPGIRTRQPEPTDRSTRRRVHFDDVASSSSSSTAAATVDPVEEPQQPVDGAPIEDFVPEAVVVEPLRVPLPSTSTSTSDAPAAPQDATRFFTRPQDRHFSRGNRPKSNYSAVLNAILQKQANPEVV